MKPEQQRIAIAEACGWFHMNSCWHFPNGAKATADGGPDNVPDYLNDLNAMHEAEQTLWQKNWASRHDFVDKLSRIISPTHGHHLQSGIDLLDATAAERAEAFLRTIGKWTTKTN